MNKNQMAIVRLENLSVNLQKALGNVERIGQMDPASLDKTFLGRLQELHQEVGMMLANLAQEDDDVTEATRREWKIRDDRENS